MSNDTSRELEQEDYPGGRRRLTLEQWAWLEENGSSPEGGIFFVHPLFGLSPVTTGVATTGLIESSPRYAEYRDGEELLSFEFKVGEKTEMPSTTIGARSLLSPIYPPALISWPAFLEPPSSGSDAVLVGVHFSDFLEMDPDLRPPDFKSDFRVVRARAFRTIDILTTKIPPELGRYHDEEGPRLPGRQVTVETMGGG